MSLLNAWHSIRQNDRNTYHDHHLCPIGNAIPAQYRKRGHRCRMRCPTCARLDTPAEMERRFALPDSP